MCQVNAFVGDDIKQLTQFAAVRTLHNAYSNCENEKHNYCYRLKFDLSKNEIDQCIYRKSIFMFEKNRVYFCYARVSLTNLTQNWREIEAFFARKTNRHKFCKLHKAIFSVFYNISQPNFVIFLILRGSVYLCG